MKYILVIESSDIGAHYTARAVRQLGFEPVFLMDLSDDLTGAKGDSRAAMESYSHLDCRTDSLPALLEASERLGRGQIAGVFTLVDTRLKVAAQLALDLGVPGLDPAVIDLKNKSRVAEWSPEVSPRTLSFRPEEWSDSELEAALQKLFLESGELILKPSDGAGAWGIQFVKTAEEVAGIRKRLLALDDREGMARDGWIAQARVRGELVSAEGYFHEGRMRLLGFTDRRKFGSTESGAGFPVDGRLEEGAKRKIESAIPLLASRSGFRNGYFHVEWLIEGEEAWLIDANMGRLGGGPVGQLLSLAYGANPVEIYAHAVELSLWGRESGDPFNRAASERHEALSILYGLRGGGRIRALHLPPLGESVFHTRILGDGAEATPMGTDDWSWVGILTGLKDETLHAIRHLWIETDTGRHAPCF